MSTRRSWRARLRADRRRGSDGQGHDGRGEGNRGCTGEAGGAKGRAEQGVLDVAPAQFVSTLAYKAERAGEGR